MVNDTKFNEKIMQPEIILETDIEIKNQSNVCLNFLIADKIDLKSVGKIEKFSILKTETNYFFSKENSSKPYFAAPRVRYCSININ